MPSSTATRVDAPITIRTKALQQQERRAESAKAAATLTIINNSAKAAPAPAAPLKPSNEADGENPWLTSATNAGARGTMCMDVILAAGLTPALAMDAFTSKADKRLAKLQRKARAAGPVEGAAVVDANKVCPRRRRTGLCWQDQKAQSVQQQLRNAVHAPTASTFDLLGSSEQQKANSQRSPFK